MRTPDDAVSRGDHLDVELVDFFECRLCLLRIQEENVCVVFLCLLDDDGEVIVVVIAFAGGKMLTERIVREEDLFLGAVRYHAVGPVEHWGRNECKSALADGERIARLDRLIGQFPVVGAQALEPVRRTCDDLCVRGEGGDERDAE